MAKNGQYINYEVFANYKKALRTLQDLFLKILTRVLTLLGTLQYDTFAEKNFRNIKRRYTRQPIKIEHKSLTDL